jgi:hypothetical protein
LPGRHITDRQIRLFMKFRHTDPVHVAAARAGFSAATGYRLAQDPRPPSHRQSPRGRRRPDPLANIFETEIVPLLAASPGLRAVAVFEEVQRRHDAYDVFVGRGDGAMRQRGRIERSSLTLQLWWVLTKRQCLLAQMWLLKRDLLPLWDARRQRWIFRPPRC